jgi:hypothetical protein
MHGMENIVISSIITIGVISYVIYRQIRPRKLSTKSLIIIPLLILFFLVKSLPSFQLTQKTMLEILVMSAVSIILGLLACRQLHVYKGVSGKAMVKGSWMYFLWWLAAFVIKSLLSIAFGETSFSNVSQTEIFLPVFFLMVTRNGYLYWKANKLGLTLH